MEREINVDIYISTNPNNSFLAVTPVIDEYGKLIKNTCKIIHRELGELVVKGKIKDIAYKFIENIEERDNFKVRGYGKD